MTVRTTTGQRGLLWLTILAGLLLAAVLALPASPTRGQEAGDTPEPASCTPTGNETVTTDFDDYAPGGTVYIAGENYAANCSVLVRVERPDGESESAGSTTDATGVFYAEYSLPPPPGVIGQYLVTVVGAADVVLAIDLFLDSPNIGSFDIAPAQYPSGALPRRFSLLIRNTSDPATCVRVVLPSSYSTTLSLDNWEVSGGGDWSAFVPSATSARTVELRWASGSKLGNGDWARLDLTATPGSTGTWGADLFDGTGSGPCSGSTANKQTAVRIGGSSPSYTATLRDPVSPHGAISPTVAQNASHNFRLRVAYTAGNALEYAAVALPFCFSGVSLGTPVTTNGGDPDFAASLIDRFIRLTGAVLNASGEFVDVPFTATASCATGSHSVSTAAWNAAEATNDATKSFVGSHPALVVQAANTAPTANPSSTSTNEDTALPVILSGSDAQMCNLTFTIVTPPAHGGLGVLNNIGCASGSPNTDTASVIYTPTSNYSGPDSFTYKTSDGSLESPVAIVNITVNAVDDPPIAVPDSVTVLEDSGTTNINVLANDTDIDGGQKTVTSVGPAGNGTTAITGGGTGVSYTPEANFCGGSTFLYTLNGGSLAQVNVTVTCVNDAPSFTSGGNVMVVENFGVYSAAWATNISAGPANEAQSLTFNVSNNNTALFSIQPAISSGGTLTFTPAPNTSGSATVTVSLKDNGFGTTGGVDTSAPQTFTVTVTPANVAPVCLNDSGSTNEDAPLNDTVACTDADSDPLTYSLVSGPASGGLVFNPDGSFNYQPGPNFNGSDSFQFRANDGTANSNTATYSITVTPVNDAPVADNDGFVTAEDTPLSVAAPGVLANDTDADGDALTAILVSGPSHGTVTFNPNGSFTYTPAANYNGPDSFSYRANDGTADSNVATVSVTVTPVNDAPVAASDGYSTAEDTPLTVSAPGILANDSDVEGSLLAASLVSGPAHGTVTLNSNGSITYTPAANYYGPDSFTYKANDGAADSNVATVGITVTPINDAPVCAPVSILTDEETVGSVAPSCTDVDGDSLIYSVSLATSGTSGFSAGNLTYDPNGQFESLGTGATGTDGFTYKANDGTVDSAAANVGVTISGVNDAPVLTSITPSTYTVQLGTSFSLAGAYTDADTGDNHTCTVDWGDTSSDSTVNGSTGACSASHSYAATGLYTVSMKVNDGTVDSNTLSVLIVVFDPSGGFVTGGGWIDSPAEAYRLDTTLTGRANFGFVSKYRRGSSTPEGQTEFQFKAGNLNFHSSSYDFGSLVVAGTKAIYKGVGTINGAGNYGFMVSVVDGPDTFRIKIWDIDDVVGDNIVYDNGSGGDDAPPTTSLGGGSIVIHKAK